jgi:predicted glutamine amidotransferase
MCELFAMSSSQPATVTYSLREFARHGGLTAEHTDGWGIGYYEGGDIRLFRDTDAAADSPLLRMVSGLELRSDIVMSHIRRATQAEVALRNTQPYTRELGGRVHLFIHNGDLERIEEAGLELGHHLPIGESDSEYAFCVLLHRLRHLWGRPRGAPELTARLDVVVEFAAAVRRLGPANFIYSDGDAVFVHGHRRKDPADDAIRPPGLHLLSRSCAVAGGTIETPGLTISMEDQHVVLAASVPLTDEGWIPVEEGEVVVLRRGEIVHRARP